MKPAVLPVQPEFHVSEKKMHANPITDHRATVVRMQIHETGGRSPQTKTWWPGAERRRRQKAARPWALLAEVLIFKHMHRHFSMRHRQGKKLTWARLIHTCLTHTCAEGGMGSWTTDKSDDLLANDPVRSPPRETLWIDFTQMVLLSLVRYSPPV